MRFWVAMNLDLFTGTFRWEILVGNISRGSRGFQNVSCGDSLVALWEILVDHLGPGHGQCLH